MGLRLSDKWIWDFWLALDGTDFHVFYLQAPREIGDPELRHRNVSIGHAVSQDLRNWEVLPDALHPAPDTGAWDDFTTWTGSIIQHEGIWYMFYTGGKRAEDALIQRIGIAVSKDLLRWERYPGNPVMVCDPNRYESFSTQDKYELAWRDPWVLQDPRTKTFHAFLTARVNDGPRDGRGVIAHAQSYDLANWQVLDPVTEPGDFGCLEVPQIVQIRGTYYLLFSTVKKFHSQARIQRLGKPPETGMHYLVGESLAGPYRYLTDSFLLGGSDEIYYAGKIVNDSQGHTVLLATRYLDRQGRFIGEMHDPIPVDTDAVGRLVLGGC